MLGEVDGVRSQLSALHEALARFGDARGAEDVAALLREHADALGFESFIYALRTPVAFAEARVVQVKGYPDEWLARYWEHAYFAVDPVIEHCTRHGTPTTWERLVPRMSSTARRMMSEAGEFGLRDGLSAPVHGPGGELGILSFARPRREARRRSELGADLLTCQLVSAYAHEAVRRVWETEPLPVPRLSSREIDCLRWAADGKTSWEISKIFAISERTVNFHFDNTVAKLGASNRQHAIARAIVLRILGPRPF